MAHLDEDPGDGEAEDADVVEMGRGGGGVLLGEDERDDVLEDRHEDVEHARDRAERGSF